MDHPCIRRSGTRLRCRVCDAGRMVVRTWAEVESTLRKRSGVEAAQAAAELLARAQPRWDGRVLPDLLMHDLRFVAPGDAGRRVDEVRVGWEQQAFVFTLRDAAAWWSLPTMRGI